MYELDKNITAIELFRQEEKKKSVERICQGRG